ncbi:hypothetical protein [Isoptericola sp. NPDC055881]
MTLQDDFLAELQHAAGQVGPVTGLDGAAMGRRAVRRVRARRAALTGVGALAAVGVVAGAGLLPGGTTTIDPAAHDVPAGWTPVAVGGVRLAVPPGLEPTTAGVWEDDRDEGEQSFVQVQPADDLALVPTGSGLTPVDVDVPGARSARYVTQDFSDVPSMVQDFDGTLQVVSETGDVVQVTLVWRDADEGEDLFTDLVRSVSVDEDAPPLPSAEGVAELRPLEGFVAGVPDGWRTAELAGLEYAAPRGWADDRGVAEAFPAGSETRSANADGSASLTVRQAAEFAAWPGSIASSPLDPASTFPLDGADVVQVETRSEDGVERATAHVRRAGGRGYVVTVETPATADGRALALQLLGTLGFAAEAERVPGAQDLPELPTSAVPAGWRETSSGVLGLRLALPPGWAQVPPPDGVDWSAGGPRETVTAVTEPGDALDAVPTAGYRYDVPGADAVVVRLGDDVTSEGLPCFLGTVELRRGDDAVVLSYSGPRGAASQERFGNLVRSLRVTGN